MEINQAAPKFQDASIAPMHTTEHIVNRTMVNLFGCERAVSAHIERKKSKLDFGSTVNANLIINFNRFSGFTSR